MRGGLGLGLKVGWGCSLGGGGQCVELRGGSCGGSWGVFFIVWERVFWVWFGLVGLLWFGLVWLVFVWR